MILHAMNIVKSAVEQVPVIAFDQPLFALAKQIQWQMPQAHGEDQFVIMFGGLHIEMALYKALGKWLDGSGWTDVLADAGVATPGVSDSLVSASHLTRTRRAHQVTAAALSVLKQKAYAKCVDSSQERPREFEVWRKEMQKNRQFLYWSRVQDLEGLSLQFVRSLREGNFDMYVTTLVEIAPWMFALDHTNYSRWLPVHIRDICELSDKHPTVHEKFLSGSFVVHKTRRVFPAIALDQEHEQENALIKGDGGAIGLTDNAAALRRWMVAGPEIARIISAFESVATTSSPQAHHKQKYVAQTSFKNDVINLVSAIEERGNPFEDEGRELVALHTMDVADSAVVQTVEKVVEVGKEQYNAFVQERFTDTIKPVSATINKNSLPLFSSLGKKTPTKEKAEQKVLKADCALFSRLYIASQDREGGLDDFFKYENQPWPLSLAQLDKMRGGQKADLVKCLENLHQSDSDRPPHDALIIDGAVAVQILSPKTASTFQEYSDTVFKPFLIKELESANRIDIIWDVYRDDSLKSATREKRGSGQRRKVLQQLEFYATGAAFCA